MCRSRGLVFDLDDTLYEEFDFLKSGYSYISSKLESNPYKKEKLVKKLLELYATNSNPFEYILENYLSDSLTMEILFQWYRYHQPDILLLPGVMETIEYVKNNFKLAIVTDGRTVTQRNKINALGLDSYISQIIISEEIGSEKPERKNFLMIEEYLDCESYVYVGDNLEKDFITPNRLGWKTICLKDRGRNIHKQDFNRQKEYLPHYVVDDWYGLKKLLINI